ncbi:MAG: hypothetical protein ACPGYT_03335 [Nitrospirales bacterium]
MKKRFRGKGRLAEATTRDEFIRGLRAEQIQTKKQGKRREGFQSQWQQLYEHCTDSGSHARLLGLREQYERFKSGVSEPAQVEIEVALLMKSAGFSVAFLEESAVRTADLECYWGVERLFVEITAIVPTPSVRCVTEPQNIDGPWLENDMYQDVFIRRLISRMAEKSKQLNRYCAPVLLAVTVPFIEWLESEKYRQKKIDLQRLAGLLSTALVGTPQISAVLLTCWNFSAQLARSNIRLHNASWVARSEAEVLLPRTRLFVANAVATYRLGAQETVALKSVL